MEHPVLRSGDVLQGGVPCQCSNKTTVLKVRDQTRELLSTLIPAAGLVVHLVNAPVATLALVFLNIAVRSNAHRNLRGDGRVCVFLLMNAVMCFVMGAVSEFYAHATAWALAAVLLTVAFCRKPSGAPEPGHGEENVWRDPGMLHGRGLGSDEDIIDATPIDND